MLTKCPECGNEVSPKATTCPKCGHPLKSTPTKQAEQIRTRSNISRHNSKYGTNSKLFKVLSIVAGILLILIIVGIIGGNVTKKPVDTPITSNAMLDDATKNTIKELVESCIDDSYKAEQTYFCDILTPTKGDGTIVSVQITSSNFVDEQICKDTIKSIIGKMIGNEQFKSINSFHFNMLVELDLKFSIDVNDVQSIVAVDDIDSHMNVQSY